MKRVIHSILRRLDLRVSRASSIDNLIGRLAASEQKASELETRLAAIFNTEAPVPFEAHRDEQVEQVIATIPGSGTAISPEVLTHACAAYSALTTSAARQRLSEHLLTSLLAAELPQTAGLLSEPSLRSLTAHELFRQAQATASFASGLLGESAVAWKEISDAAPSPFNLACQARVLIAGKDKRRAFSVLAEGVERYPQSVLLATELAMFFMRADDVDSANIALGAIRHVFLDERSALTAQQNELDRQPDGSARATVIETDARHAGTEFQNAFAAREAASRRLIEQIVGDANGAVDPTLVLQRDSLPAASNGGHTVLSHMGADACLPGTLAKLYGRCRKLGIKHLVIGQTIDFDRDSLRYHRLGEFPRVSRLGGQGRMLHDFRKLLDDAGYAITEFSFVPPVLVPKLDEPGTGHRLLHAVLRDGS